jgi:glucuronate isomerase
MSSDNLVRDLTTALAAVPLIDPHSHIDPLRPVARSLDDILGYHYYTELAHSAGMTHAPLAKDYPARDRVRAIVRHMARFDNTTQYGWFVDIARTFLGFDGSRVTEADADRLFDTAERTFTQLDWEQQVITKSNLEKVFLTNEFDDPYVWSERPAGPNTATDSTRPAGPVDPSVYVPCLRTDALVFHLDKPDTRQRLAKATGVDVRDAATLRQAVRKLFERFTARGAKACAISLPPDFAPARLSEMEFDRAVQAVTRESKVGRAVQTGLHAATHLARTLTGTITGSHTDPSSPHVAAEVGTFTLLAEHCREFGLPFDLMIGVNRRVYEAGVFQGQDLFDRRTSLIQYRELFNAFPEVTFPISVLTSGQNQELVAYSWIFPTVVANGHWWYSNIPAYIRRDLSERLQAVPKTKLIGYYSDAYKLEFVLPKYGMYRRVLAGVLADEFVRPGMLSETEAVALGTRLLRDNVREVFKV